MRKKILTTSILLSLSAHTSALAIKCPQSFEVESFIQKWNRQTKDIPDGNWRLPPYKGLGYIRQSLDDFLFLTLRVSRESCINEISIRSSRHQTYPYAALVAWSTAIKLTNSSSQAVRIIFSALNLNQLSAGGTHLLNDVEYQFVETSETNVFSVRHLVAK
jgi:hypothetical protein